MLAPCFVPQCRTVSQVAKPSTASTDELKRYVTKTLRAHLRFTTDVYGRRPPSSATIHLVEYVVRTALRERWNLNDVAGCADSIQRMMFAEHSELIEMADMSGFTFVEDATAGMEEVLLSDSAIALFHHAPAASQMPEILDTSGAADGR